MLLSALIKVGPIHFSLQEVLGRCTVDVRVCASPGRDRDVDEKRIRGEPTIPSNGRDKPAPPTTRRGRKRGKYNSNYIHNVPPQNIRTCMTLSTVCLKAKIVGKGGERGGFLIKLLIHVHTHTHCMTLTLIVYRCQEWSGGGDTVHSATQTSLSWTLREED